MDELNIIKKENEDLKKQILELQERLKKYTN
jgi:cell division septum initiation protein DivIVA